MINTGSRGQEEVSSLSDRHFLHFIILTHIFLVLHSSVFSGHMLGTRRARRAGSVNETRLETPETHFPLSAVLPVLIPVLRSLWSPLWPNYHCCGFI